jgi:hypothetical protein
MRSECWVDLEILDVHTMKKMEIIEDVMKRNWTLDWRLANSYIHAKSLHVEPKVQQI